MSPPSFRVLPSPRILLAAATLLLPAPVLADPLAEQLKADLPGLLALYRDLHAHPELSLQEKATSARLATEVKKLGFTVTPGVGGMASPGSRAARPSPPASPRSTCPS